MLILKPDDISVILKSPEKDVAGIAKAIDQFTLVLVAVSVRVPPSPGNISNGCIEPFC